MKMLSELPGNWANTALSVAQEQGFLPDSPAETVDRELRLCAAACVAYAGLKLMRPGREEKFRSSLRTQRDKQIVISAFSELGLSRAVCLEAMMINDRTLPEDRVRVFRKALGL